MGDDPKYWFRAKKHGYGWGLPATWEGWVVMGTFIALVIAVGVLLSPAWSLPLTLLLAAGLIAISYAKGEPPKWRWGGRS